MTASSRTFISLGSLLLAIGCGSNSAPSGNTSGAASEPGCSTAPACGTCGTCLESCVCQTGDTAKCSAACHVAPPSTTTPVDPSSQAGCTNGVGCGSRTTCLTACTCNTGDSVKCEGQCGGTQTGAGGASGTAGASGSPGGATSVGAGGATGGQGGSAAAGGATGAAGSTGVPGDTWTVNSNLDANGKLIVPAAGEGYQISTPVFDLQPGEEVFKCFHVAMPNPTEFDVGQWESQMTAGSHHFILYKNDGDTAPSGQLDSSGCTLGFGGPTWLYTSGTPHSELPMPDGVAMPVSANERVVFDMHYINLTQDVIHANVTLNMNKVKAAQYQIAQALVSFNFGIAIPALGTQTVGGDCTPGPGANFFLMGTHTHRRGIEAKITRVGGANETLVDTTNWDNPTPGLWETPPYLTFAPGEKFHYQCSYQNDRNAITYVGSSAANNEMCMAITYFFPASAGGTCN